MRKTRTDKQLRPVKIKTHFLKYADGSCLVEFGQTKVICSASIEEGVPKFLKGTGRGWITAEYSMLPRSCRERIRRESSAGKPSGRTQEIQRLIGRSLRTAVDLNKLGEHTIWIDCDVIQGDGGTRTASVTGGFVALYLALQQLVRNKMIEDVPVKYFVAAVSLGIVGGKMMLDLDYVEDSGADLDMNFVMTENGKFIEIQGTAEKEPFSDKEMARLMQEAKHGIKRIITVQKKALKLR